LGTSLKNSILLPLLIFSHADGAGGGVAKGAAFALSVEVAGAHRESRPVPATAATLSKDKARGARW